MQLSDCISKYFFFFNKVKEIHEITGQGFTELNSQIYFILISLSVKKKKKRRSLKYVNRPFRIKNLNPDLFRFNQHCVDTGKNHIVINAHETKQKTLVRCLVCVCLRHLGNFLSGTLIHSSCCQPYVSPAGLSLLPSATNIQ